MLRDASSMAGRRRVLFDAQNPSTRACSTTNHAMLEFRTLKLLQEVGACALLFTQILNSRIVD